MELLAMTATVYWAGLTFSAGTCRFLCSVVWFLLTLTVADEHFSASEAMSRSASKSLDRMRTDPFSMPQSAFAGAAEKMPAASRRAVVASSPDLFMFPSLFLLAAKAARSLIAFPRTIESYVMTICIRMQ